MVNGDPPTDGLLHRLAAETDLFLAADGAAHHLEDAKLRPHAVVGDLDSLDMLVIPRLGGPELIRIEDPELSDLEKCIRVAIDRGAKQVTVTGAMGGRIDHILTHISLLIRYHETLQIRIRETGSEVRAVSGETSFAGEPGDTLSLACFAPVVGVTVEGVKWPLNDDILQPGSRPVSNEFLGASARIMVRRGVLVASHVMKAHV